MEPAPVLAVVVVVWCASLLVRLGLDTRRGAPVALGWTVKAVAALAAVGAAAWAGSDAAVYGVSAAWAVFLLTPALAAQWQVRSLAAMRPDRAKLFARVVRLLHPFDGWRHAPRQMDALARAEAVDDVGRVRAAPARLAVVTWTLIAANVLGFGLELWRGGPDGSTDLENLFALGALWPPAVIPGGEWWRLATALFLHFGVLHLALNMLALGVFGRIVERALGRLGMAALYAVAGIGSMAFVLALERATGAEPTLLVGASGAIFGIVGALAALLASEVAAGSRHARRRLVEIGLLVALQIAFDVMTPEVSLSAHAGGFLVGAVAGALLARFRPVQRPT